MYETHSKQPDKKQNILHLHKVTIHFSTHEINTIFTEKPPNGAKLLGQAFDYSQDKFLVMYKIPNNGKRRFFQFYDLKKKSG